MRRTEFLQRLKELGNDPTQRIVALHYDILTEGIDVNGFTGLLVFRTMGKIKFIQGYGRTARLHPIDRKNFNEKLVLPRHWKRQMKPFAYVLIPDVATCNADMRDQTKKLIYELRNYDYDFAEVTMGDQSIHGEAPIHTLDPLNADEKRLQMEMDLGKLLAEIEDESVAALSETEFATFSRCIALGLKRRQTVETPQGQALLVGFGDDFVRLKTEAGDEIRMTPEEAVKTLEK